MYAVVQYVQYRTSPWKDMLSIEHYFSEISYLDILNMMGFKINEGYINHWNPILNLGFLSMISNCWRIFKTKISK